MTTHHQPTAQHLAQALGEPAAQPHRQIEAIMHTLGSDVALDLLREPQAIEAQGGLLTSDATRRRTPGGVFFSYARTRMTPEQRVTVFGQSWHHANKSAAAGHPVPPPHPGVSWTERATLLHDARTQPGKATTVKVTLIGKPGKVIEKPDFTLLMLNQRGPLPALPKGIPVPAQVPATSYVVSIGAKQWRGVAAALKTPADGLIVEGTQIYDAEYDAIAVFATNTTTKALQQAKRQQQPQG